MRKEMKPREPDQSESRLDAEAVAVAGSNEGNAGGLARRAQLSEMKCDQEDNFRVGRGLDGM